MNKLLLICITSALLFGSCQSKDKNNFQNIKESVESIESLVYTYDNNVQSAIDSKNFDYIKVVAKATIDSTLVKLDGLKTMQVSSSHEDFLKAAISYIIAMQEIVSAEEAYSNLTDSVSAEEANRMDGKLMRSSEKAKEEHTKYLNILNELSAN